MLHLNNVEKLWSSLLSLYRGILKLDVSFVTMLQISGYYGKCLMKVEPTANVISRTFTTQLHQLPVTHSSLPLTADSYGRRDYRLMNGQTSQRILPPSEGDCMLPASKWSPPFPVSPEQLAQCRNFAEMCCEDLRESSVDGYCEAGVPVELRSVNENHRDRSDYEGQ